MTDRAVVGLAVAYGQPLNVGSHKVAVYPRHLDRVVATQPTVPMRGAHGDPTWTSVLRADHIGVWHRWAHLSADGDSPGGLLAYGTVDDTRAGAVVLDLLRYRLTPRDVWSTPQGWGLSIGGSWHYYGDELSCVVPDEVSFVDEGASRAARVLGVGPDADDIWSLLTGDVLAVV